MRMTPLVKICGLTRISDALAASEAGASFLGFIFVASSRRYVDLEQAREIARAVRKISATTKIVGVFKDQSVDRIRRAVGDVNLDLVQLHGSESPELAATLGVPVIKAFRVGSTPPDADGYESAEWLMFDTLSQHADGGTGKTFDWSLLRGQARRTKLFLSGGLNESNVVSAIEAVRPDAVDVSSGVEDEPGIKNVKKIRRFMEKVMNAQ